MCFLLANFFTYLFSYLELGFENFSTNLIINNLATFFAVLVVISVREIKFFLVEDTDIIEWIVIFGLISGIFYTVVELSYTLSNLRMIFLSCSFLMIFLFSMVRLKFGIINGVTIATIVIVLRFFFGLTTTLENYFYFSAIILTIITVGFSIRNFLLLSKKIIKKVKQKIN